MNLPYLEKPNYYEKKASLLRLALLDLRLNRFGHNDLSITHHVINELVEMDTTEKIQQAKTFINAKWKTLTVEEKPQFQNLVDIIKMFEREKRLHFLNLASIGETFHTPTVRKHFNTDAEKAFFKTLTLKHEENNLQVENEFSTKK